MREKVGRWKTGDIMEKDKKLYRVIGFILDPAVIFNEIDGDDHVVEIAGCMNESELIRYEQHEKGE